MVAPTLSSRLTDTLLHQDGPHDPDIRTLSLATLNDSDLVSSAALFWTQLGWVWALAVSGWLWIGAFMAIDLVLYGVRWRLRRGLTPRGLPLDPGSQTLSAWINLLLIALIACDIVILAQAPSERASILGIILAIGYSGYVTALFTAFPILATLNIVALNAAFSLGLALGFSDVTRPLAILGPGIAVAFWLLMRQTHATLLGAIRAQHVHRQTSLHDPLTKLPNRLFMRDKLAHLLGIVGRPDGPPRIAVLCIDLDGFKAVNDRYGHAAGDWVLIHVADLLRQRLPAGSVACRIGGDEYVVLLPGWGEEAVRAFGRTLIAAIEQPLDVARTVPVRIGASIGAAIAADALTRPDDLLEEADAALYDAKRAGKGQLHFGGRAADAPAPAPRQASVLDRRR